MKYVFLFFASGILFGAHPLFACEVCGAGQPELLREFTHGTGPQGGLDYLIVAITAVIVFFALGYAIKCLLRPGEREMDHIKRTVLTEEFRGS